MSPQIETLDLAFRSLAIRRRYLLDAYAPVIGADPATLTTPALIVDLPKLDHNLAAMADWTKGRAAVRPHFKAHKCVEVAAKQVSLGAVGVTTATLWEAIAVVHAGLDSVLIANEITAAGKLELLGELAHRAHITIAIDSTDGCALLGEAIRRAGSEIGVVIEIDVGMGRGGARSLEEARAIGREAATHPGLHLRGVMSWEGHMAMEVDRAVRAEGAAAAVATTLATAAALRDDGFDMSIVSAGGTNTYDLTGANPEVTEIQAGTYALMDTSYHRIAPLFTPNLAVIGTVISRHGQRAVLDGGSKVMSTTHLAPPQPVGVDATVAELHEEHTLLDVADGQPLALGDRVALLVSYGPGTMNLHDVVHVVDGDRVVDVWPTSGRGPGAGPLLRRSR